MRVPTYDRVCTTHQVEQQIIKQQFGPLSVRDSVCTGLPLIVGPRRFTPAGNKSD